MNFSLSVNGQSRSVDAAPDTPLLWILRDPERQSWHDKMAGTLVIRSR